MLGQQELPTLEQSDLQHLMKLPGVGFWPLERLDF